MSEIFKNFLSLSTETGEKIVVPSSKNGQNTVQIQQGSNVMGQMIRDENTVAQIHSLYITQANNDRSKVTNLKMVDLIIRDTDIPQLKIYVGHNINVVPSSPYYIEKNITLSPTQYLCINVPAGVGTNNNDVQINVCASTILFSQE